MKILNNNSINVNWEDLEEIGIDELIYEIDNSKDFKMFQIENNDIDSTILIKVFKQKQ